MKVLLNRCYGGFCLSHEAIALYNGRVSKRKVALWHGLDADRTDPELHAVVEELGLEAAAGSSCKLVFEELPPELGPKEDHLWRIIENDGMEEIMYDGKALIRHGRLMKSRDAALGLTILPGPFVVTVIHMGHTIVHSKFDTFKGAEKMAALIVRDYDAGKHRFIEPRIQPIQRDMRSHVPDGPEDTSILLFDPRGTFEGYEYNKVANVYYPVVVKRKAEDEAPRESPKKKQKKKSRSSKK